MEESPVMSHVAITEAPAQAGYDALRDASFRASYDDARDLWSDEPAMQPAVDRLLARLPQGARTLDIGAGRGRDSVKLLAAGHHVDHQPAGGQAFGEGRGGEAGAAAARRILVVEQQDPHARRPLRSGVGSSRSSVSVGYAIGRGKRYASERSAAPGAAAAICSGATAR